MFLFHLDKFVTKWERTQHLEIDFVHSENNTVMVVIVVYFIAPSFIGEFKFSSGSLMRQYTADDPFHSECEYVLNI